MKELVSSSEERPNLMISIYIYILAMLFPQISGFKFLQSNAMLFNIVVLALFLFYSLYYFTHVKTINMGGLILFLLFASCQLATLHISRQLNQFYPFDKLDVNYVISPVYILLFYGVFNKYKLTGTYLDKFMQMYIYLMLYASLYNFIVNYGDIRNLLRLAGADQVSFSSFFEDRNTYGKFLHYGCISAICSYDRTSRKAYLYVIVFLIMNLVLTLSRTSVLSLLIFILIYALASSKSVWRDFFLMVLIAGAIVGFLASDNLISDFVISFLVRPERGLTHRDFIWAEGWKIFVENDVFFGSGYSAAKSMIENYSGYGFHSGYLMALTSIGLCGFLFMAFFICRSFRNVYFIIRLDRKTGAAFLGVLLSFLAMAVTESVMIFQSSTISFVSTVMIVMLPQCYLNGLRGETADSPHPNCAPS